MITLFGIILFTFTYEEKYDPDKELLLNLKYPFSFDSGKNVLNQKSELQRALERHREAASRREAEKIRDESYKDDPRTALQRAIEQRARHIQLTVIRHT
jgi:hypothetical protein